MSEKSIKSKIPLILIFLFNIVYISMACVTAVRNINHEFIIYIGVVIVLLFVISSLHFCYGLNFVLMWLFSFWGLLHMSGGLVNVPFDWPVATGSHALYNLWLIPDLFKYDQFVHAYGFGITVWLIWHVYHKSLIKKYQIDPQKLRPTAGILFLCVIGSMGLGALNEIIEFIATLTVPETNVGGYINTGWDLVYNSLGAVIVACVLFIHGKLTRK